MIIISFCIDNERYGIFAGNVIEIIPIVKPKPVPMTEKYVLGLINYRGRPTPVIDMCQLFSDRPCSSMLSTRIILIRLNSDDNCLLGIITEMATETLECDTAQIISTNLQVKNAPFLGGILHDENGMLQILDIDKLLQKRVRETLFQTSVEQ